MLAMGWVRTTCPGRHRDRIARLSDAAIEMNENATSASNRCRRALQADRTAAIVAPLQGSRPALFFTLLIITVSYLPVFTGHKAKKAAVSQPLAFHIPSRWRVPRCCP